jgi:hypothetical protein
MDQTPDLPAKLSTISGIYLEMMCFGYNQFDMFYVTIIIESKALINKYTENILIRQSFDFKHWQPSLTSISK